MSSPNPLEALGDFLSGPFRRMGASSAAASRAPAASSSAPQAEATADERDTGGGVLPKSKAGKPAKLSAGARALALTEAEAQERKARREAEARARAESDAQQARLEARRQRQQEALRRPADPTGRVFQLDVRGLEASNASDAPLGRFGLRLTLGGDYEEVAGSGLVPRGKRGRAYRTAVCAGLASGATQRFESPLGSSGAPAYWFGTYGDLEQQDLLLEAWRPASLLSRRPDVTLASWRRPLVDVARGSVELEVELEEGAGRALLRLRCACFFQEVFEFKLRFVQW